MTSPPLEATRGSITSVRIDIHRRCVPSSSPPIKREYPTTSMKTAAAVRLFGRL
nr:hypothetical protein [Bradyrhizobium cytisi]